MIQKNLRITIVASLFSLSLPLTGVAEARVAETANRTEIQVDPTAEFPELPPSGKKCQIDDHFYFTYNFTEKPRIGTAILRVRVYDRDGNRTTGFTVLGRSDMPTMAGAHDSGDQEFKLNRKGDYLLPVNIVMPGGWEVRLTFKRGEDVILRGVFYFNV